MTRKLRFLASIVLAALALSGVGRARPVPFSAALDAAVAGFINPGRQSPVSPRIVPTAQTAVTSKSKPGEQFTLYRDANGEVVCRTATGAEKQQMDTADLNSLGMLAINHEELNDKTQTI